MLKYISNSILKNENLQKFSKFLGLDRAIVYVLLGRGISLISQPITIIFIGRFLTGEAQGFYYTFLNVIALSIFFELGLGTILTQFASHEFAYLKWNDDGKVSGNPLNLWRLLALGKKTITWYATISVFFSIIIIPLGIQFFKSESQNVNYVLPWVLLAVFSSINLTIYAFTSILEGCGKVTDIQLLKLVQSLIGNIIIWGMLFSGMGLYAICGLSIAQSLISLFWIRRKYWPILQQILRINKETQDIFSWRKEIIPLQWKIGISWVSGYIIYQSINPMLFKFQGAIEAGQMGMSNSIANLASVIGMAWLSTKIPLYGSLISQKKFDILSSAVKKNTIMAVSVASVSAILILIALIVLIHFNPIYEQRVLPISSIIILIFSSLINIYINSLASYLRAFKKEPFLISSIIGAILTGATIYICARYFNTTFLVQVLLIINIIYGIPVNVYIFKKFKKSYLNQ